jgi:hypothetical protein
MAAPTSPSAQVSDATDVPEAPDAGAASVTVPDRIRLGLTFDAVALGGEATGLSASAWTRHFNERIYEGEWTGVALRAAAGAPSVLYADPKRTADYEDTPLLHGCPLLAQALARFECQLTSARLLSLAPGASIREHRDYRLSLRHQELRLHIPLLSEAGVEFVHDGHVVDMVPGECWYFDFTLPHRVKNLSAQRRIHLVVDCLVNPWLTAQITGAAGNGSPPE